MARNPWVSSLKSATFLLSSSRSSWHLCRVMSSPSTRWAFAGLSFLPFPALISSTASYKHTRPSAVKISCPCLPEQVILMILGTPSQLETWQLLQVIPRAGFTPSPTLVTGKAKSNSNNEQICSFFQPTLQSANWYAIISKTLRYTLFPYCYHTGFFLRCSMPDNLNFLPFVPEYNYLFAIIAYYTDEYCKEANVFPP